MKSFFLSFAMALFPFFSFAQSYDALWKTEQQLETDGKPQSAYAFVQKILKKALAEGHRGQALSARLRAAGLHQEWAPDSFFTDVAELEALRRQEQQPESRAVLASVLAEIYEDNSRRSQAHDLELTSEDMKEWTREQYDSAALDNWRRSLEDIPTLAAASSKDWLPFVSQAEHSSYFHHDLLHLLWQRVRDHRRGVWRLSGEVESYQSMALRLGKAVRAEYDRRGNREASLLVALDLLMVEFPDSLATPLLALKDAYSDLPLCTEVYLRLLATAEEEIAVPQKVALAEEALHRYPRYERIGEVRNRLNQLRQPSVEWTGNAVYYPGKTYTWRLTSQNTSSVEILVYRLRDDFREEEVARSRQSIGDYFRKNASLVERLTPTLHPGKPYESRDDSLQWTAPAVGRYALVFVATTDEREARKKVVSDHFNTFCVTSLKTMTRFLTEQELEVVVVDAESGQPRQGASVALYSEDTRSDRRSLISSQQTSAEGRVRFRGISKEVRRLLVTATAPAPAFPNATSAKTGTVDSYLPEEYLWRHGSYSPEEQTSTTLHLYTDRAIYRPGQTVHLSGVAYNQKHWDATTLAEKSYELTLRDANRKVVATQTVATDSMGVLAADFLLPQGGLPGLYRIDCDGDVVSFRVEEYKRPTFEVKMDEAPALQWPQELITLTGKAVGYNGVPVRDARVAGHYRFTYPYFWWYRHADSPSLPTDTVETDEDGKFAIAVPLHEIPSEALRHGLVLQLDVEVLSTAGETREGALRVPLCTTPLRLNITMAEQQDRDRLQPPTFSLLTSTGKPAEGRITWTIYPAATEAEVPTNGVATGKLETKASAADLSALTTALQALPSGDYKLKATAQAGADTASAEARFFLFSMADKRLPHRVELWLYCPTDSFDLQHPARLQFGSSYENVALYYSLVGKEGLIRNELIPLSDELRTMEIPYQPEYGDGVTVYFAFVKGGTCFTRQQSLKLSQPSKELKWQWTSFRDHTHPGEQETWTLRISAPDGTPVAANLMATIFDASLNQLQPHYWQLFVNRFHHLRQLPWNFSNTFQEGNSREHIFFPMKDYRSEPILFDSFDSRWANGLAFGYGVRSIHPMMMKAAAPARSMGSYQAMDSDALEGRIAGLNLSEEESAPSDATRTAGAEVPQEASAEAAPQTTLAPAPAALRTNFNETAAFFPRLHTDPTTGEVIISFTLPESLTTWQLLGLAHTEDMMTSTIQAQTIARKELMARLYLPRFLRGGDQSSLRATIDNLTSQPLSGKATWEIFDPETEQVILRKEMDYEAAANGQAVLALDYTPSEDYPIVAVRLVADAVDPAAAQKGSKRSSKSAVTFSDGEQQYLPILSSKEYVTESIEILADGKGTFTTDLSTLFNNNAASATQRRLTVDYTTHPIWNVVQALPALRESQHDDVLSLASVFYSNALAAHIAATTPRLREIIALWKQQAATKNGAKANESPLARNEELKQIILDETPWLREADSDSERRAQLIDLFDENLLSSRVGGTLHRLRQRQEADGGFAWFPGMRSSELMTRLVAMELTHLRQLTDDFSTLSDEARQQVNSLLRSACNYVAQQNAKMVAEMKKAEAEGAKINTGQLMHLHYIYITQRAGVKLTKNQQADVRYLLDHLKGSVAGMSNDERAMAAVVLKDAGRQADSRFYFEAMKEHLTTTAARGTFFDYAGGSFTPTGNKIIIHTTAMEAANELASDDRALNSGLRRWLLQQKRTQMWESSICTADAIYALLKGASAAADLQSTAKDKLTLHYGKKQVVVTAETNGPAALGYVRNTYCDGAAPESITVERNSTSEAWGAVYAQYLTPIAEAAAHGSGLSVRRELSTTAPRLGDKLTTRYIITADRDYEYVCLRAARPAAAEPAEQLSGYRYQGGLGYYLAVRDAHNDYFFDHLPKGTYVLEESAYIDRTGCYTTGLVTLRCLYAPEYGANTATQELKVR